MSALPPPADAPVNPADVMRDSPWRRRFIEHTLATRDDQSSRDLLEQEWRYLAPLLAPLPRDAEVLDLACGSGPHVLAWAERGYRVTGVDFDHALLVAGRTRVARGATPAPGVMAVPAPAWNCGDATRLPYRDGSFDLVFCNSLLEHVPDWRAVLSETARVLRPGGVAVVYTTNRTCPLQQEVNHFPFYSWLPDPIQRRVLAWIMEHRRDLVNWTDFPAVNWFTFPGLRREFDAVGLEPHDRIDLLARAGTGGAKGVLVRAMHRMPALKWPYYVYAISMGLYGVKR
jgi:2-polyprenyl-6-hydroxyphenyl methylase/3-demethylubiquinone-9 3-methyltransferase